MAGVKQVETPVCETDRVPGAPPLGDEVADLMVYLASDLASFITGAYIPVCGGYIMPTI